MTGSPSAISLQNVSKKYKLYNSAGERLREVFHPFKKKFHKEFWALQNIQLEVAKGRTLGIIGRNGSGKSTLLQIMAGILRPTSGNIFIGGRISPLLELGTGFNPEFTGRENVLLHGNLMGFSPSEIRKRVPQIEAFAEIGEFFDQPVKTYSSGMFLRLAFAAAIHADPNILVIDEVLAVGDAKFQHKCYEKFIEYQKLGKTILLVTHDMNALVRHCDQAILLEKGEIFASGEPHAIANRYHELLLAPKAFRENQGAAPAMAVETESSSAGAEDFFSQIHLEDRCIHNANYNPGEQRYGDKRAEIIDYLILSENGHNPVTARFGEKIQVYVKIRFHEKIEYPIFGFSIKTMDGVIVYGTNTRLGEASIPPASATETVVLGFSLHMNLHSDDYFIHLGVGERRDQQDWLADSRASLIHLRINGEDRFDGFVDLQAQFHELARMDFEKKGGSLINEGC